MPLAIGTRLATYEIAGALGAGGMGEVYRARDTKLGRSVAIKVLPDAFLSDADRIARFEREAKMLAALNHQHIASLYGMEHSDERHFLVMELVEGETLAERLERGPIPVRVALEIARQIADALEAAHEKGVVHRDLKPANVKITPDDRVKVLDFGLARAMESDPASNIANSPTLSMMATQAGLILGTAAYMSPEQAKGFPADHRSDIFSFGCVLYEMLTARPPFRGDTAADILASVLVRDPDLAALPPALDPRVRDLVRRCLEKHPKRRWQAVGDVRAEIEAILASPVQAAVAGSGPRRPRWKIAVAFAVVAAAAGALGAMVVWRTTPGPRPAIVTRFVFMPPATQQFSAIGRQMLAISPDGSRIAYAANGRVYIRSMSSMDVVPIPGVDSTNGVTSIAFSPDSQSIAFWAIDRTLKRVSVAGGAAVTICKAENPFGLSWGPDGLLFGQSQGVMRVAPFGGSPQLIVKSNAGEIAHGPQMLPGGTAVLFSVGTGLTPEQWDRAAILAESLKTGQRKVLIEGGADARYVPTGHLVYALGGTLFAVPFDPRTLEVKGGPVSVVEGVRRAVAGATGSAHFAFSSTGTLVFVPGPAGSAPSQFDLALVDRKGLVEPLKLPAGSYEYPRVSRDGRHIAFGTDDGKEAVVWIYDLAGTSAMRHLTFGGRNRFPVWSPDGRHLAFQSDRDGDPAIFRQRVDGTGTERLTTPAKGTSHIPDSWSPDGEHLLYTVNEATGFSLWVLSLRDRKAMPFGAVRSGARTTAVFSPDGRWVAYAASSQGTTATQVYVQPFPATGVTYQLFANVGDNPHHPLWSPDGNELFYVPRVGGFESVRFIRGPTVAFGNPAPAPRAFPTAAPTTPRPFDVTPGGKILCVVASGQGSAAALVQYPIHVVVNWFEELRSRVPATR